MKTKLAPRHIVPVVCYAILFLAFVLIAVLGFGTHFTSSESLEGTGMIGLLVVGIAAAVKFILILIGIGGALFTLVPLVFSSVNITKKGRKLAIACLVFDALWCHCFLVASLATLINFESLAPILISVFPLALCALALVMNILNIKHNESFARPQEAEDASLISTE